MFGQQKLSPSSAIAFTFWLACGLSVFQAGGDSCDVVRLWLCSVVHCMAQCMVGF